MTPLAIARLHEWDDRGDEEDEVKRQDAETQRPEEGAGREWILYDARACNGAGTDDAQILVCCDDEAEARTYCGDFGQMAAYSYARHNWNGPGRRYVDDERWEWDWSEDDA